MNKQTQTTATAESRELVLFAVNDYATYKQIITPVIKSLRKKVTAGTFDQSNIKAFYNVATFAAKRYAREFCDAATPYYKVFTADCRRATAAELLSYYMEDITEE